MQYLKRNFVLLLSFTIFTKTLVQQLEYVPGISIFELQHVQVPNLNLSITNSNISQCNEGKRLDCGDCHTQLICDYERHILARRKCPAWMPYCSAGQCSTQPAQECTHIGEVVGNEKKSELCPAAGFFPDPSHCNRFHLCDSTLRAIPYVCPRFYVYDPLTSLCKLHKQPSDCPVLNCHLHVNRFTTYPLDRSLYTFCAYFEGKLQLSLHQCANEMLFDESSQNCVFGCIEGEGRFAHSDDKSKYYLCLRNQMNQVGYKARYVLTAGFKKYILFICFRLFLL